MYVYARRKDTATFDRASAREPSYMVLCTSGVRLEFHSGVRQNLFAFAAALAADEGAPPHLRGAQPCPLARAPVQPRDASCMRE